jgi:hypothetical protein
MRTARSTFSLLVTLLAAASCGGDSPTGVDGGDDGGTTREILANPSFSDNINEILVRKGCTASQCHGGGAGNLTLTGSASMNLAALIDVPSSREPAFVRVLPNDADNSYLVIKLEGRQTSGQRMPIGGAALDNIDLTNIKNWINNGAPNN